jgi:transposase
MNKVTMIGCDLHDASMVLKIAVGLERAVKKTFATAQSGEMIAWVKDYAKQHGTERIVFAYEASGQGFGLHDDLTDAGIECYVLAPTHLPHTAHQRKQKTDDKDAEMILEEVRAHVLAGRKLPAVWVPDPATRDDREAVRMRLQLGGERTRTKNQIRNLLKRGRQALPAWFTKSGEWSKRSVQWLCDMAAGDALPQGIATVLNSLVELYKELCRQMKALDKAILQLAKSARYAPRFRKLKLLSGVGTLTAMVFLSEIGDLDHFANRRQLAAYLGLAPASFESGKCDDRKGHITRQGPARVRHVLCQAAWATLRYSESWRAQYDRVKRGSKKRAKIAIVAVMRRLAILMWHTARSPEIDELIEEWTPPQPCLNA